MSKLFSKPLSILLRDVKPNLESTLFYLSISFILAIEEIVSRLFFIGTPSMNLFELCLSYYMVPSLFS